MAKQKDSYWSWQSNLVSVPPSKKGEDWQYVPKGEAAKIYRKRYLKPDYREKVDAPYPEEPQDEGIRGTMRRERKLEEVSKVGAKSSNDSTAKSKSKVEDLVERGKSNGAPKLNVDTSIVDFLKSIGEDSSFAGRKNKAKEYGIEGEYTGSAKQNVAMLKAAKERAKAPEGVGITPPASEPRGKDVPGSTDTEDMAEVESQLREQNRDYVDPSDFQDGTWDKYVSFVKEMRKKRSSAADGLPNFQEYLRYAEGMA